MFLYNAVRLVGSGSNPTEGRLEVLHDAVWGTVCDDGFNDTAAKVACNTLGFGYVKHTTISQVYN